MPEEATGPPKKRAKIVSACAECRRKKTKCNGEQPCRNCQKSAVHCIYPSLQQDDKRNGPTRAALESIEERLKNIEDMLRAVLSNQHTIDPTFQRLPSIHNLSASSAYDNNNSSSSNSNSNDNNDNNNKYVPSTGYAYYLKESSTPTIQPPVINTMAQPMKKRKR